MSSDSDDLLEEWLAGAVETMGEWEVGWPVDLVGPEFAEIAAAHMHGTRDGRLRARPVLDIAAEALAGWTPSDPNLGPDDWVREYMEALHAEVQAVLQSGRELEPLRSPSSDPRPLRSTGEDRFMTELRIRRL